MTPCWDNSRTMYERKKKWNERTTISIEQNLTHLLYNQMGKFQYTILLHIYYNISPTPCHLFRHTDILTDLLIYINDGFKK